MYIKGMFFQSIVFPPHAIEKVLALQDMARREKKLAQDFKLLIRDGCHHAGYRDFVSSQIHHERAGPEHRAGMVL